MREIHMSSGRTVRGILLLTCALACAGALAHDKVKAADGRKVFIRAINGHESKVPPYTLEDPLVFRDGTRVASAADWPRRRREILDLFAREMYGEEPPKPETVLTELVCEKKNAIGGFATRRQYRMWFRADKSGPSVNWFVWIPNPRKAPVPVILFLDYRGASESVFDEDIPLTTGWEKNNGEYFVTDHRVSEKTRGLQQNPESRVVLPLDSILARGYAVMTACYAEVSPDPVWCQPEPEFSQDKFSYTGVFDLWGRRDESRTDNITALGAWGWALSRGLDLAERIAEIDAKKSVVTGYSRLGKAALLAGARDERFAITVPIQTGGGGVPLMKRDFGENVSFVNRGFCHWYCKAYAKYSEAPWRDMPFDQHLFLAAVAPRALLVEGYTDNWYDPHGEYLAVRAASPVWKFLGLGGMPDVAYPDEFDTSAIGRDCGYVRRGGRHGIAAYDWMWMLAFADRHFAAGKGR